MRRRGEGGGRGPRVQKQFDRHSPRGFSPLFVFSPPLPPPPQSLATVESRRMQGAGESRGSSSHRVSVRMLLQAKSLWVWNS